MSKKKADPEFVPEVIEDDAPGLMAAFVPSQIEAGDGYDPRLIGFPLNIVFVGIPNDGQTSLVDVRYEPAAETFREDPERKEMRYFTKPKNGYSMRVIFEKSSGRWLTKKFKGRRLIQTACGLTFDQAMMQTTMAGPEAGER